MKSVTIRLTKKQREQIASMVTGMKGRYGILGQAYLTVPIVSSHEAGTADFHYCSPEQFKIINRAIVRAKKLDK